MRRALRMLTALVALGCGTSTPSGTGVTSAPPGTAASNTPPPMPASGRTVDECYLEDGAPDPWACATASDCMAGGLLDGARCCMRGVTHAHTRTYHEWQTSLFRSRCGGTCMDNPGMPLECQMQLRCVDGRCDDSCDLPASDTDLDGMEPSELEAACARGVSAACDRLGH